MRGQNNPFGRYLHDKRVHVSTLEEKLGKFEISVERRQIDERLADAAHQRAALVKDCPQFKPLALLVALFFDPLADFLDFYPRTFNEEVSGILTIKEDVAMTKAFGELIKEEQGRRFRTEDATGLPPNSKDFALLQNEAALRVVPKDFERQCLSAADYK